ncbi:MAG: glycosyltransferase [Pseudomonadota bacterium]
MALSIWLYLLAFRAGFWRSDQRLESGPVTASAQWPPVIALVPARDEAEVIAESLLSVLSQRYDGLFAVAVIDDHSRDGTKAIAENTAEQAGLSHLLTMIEAKSLPAGWSGKLWALSNGLEAVLKQAPEAKYLWLSDADIWHEPDCLQRLVAKAEGEKKDAVSVMALLSCKGFWERLLIPPFIYFFQMLYPFGRINDPNDPMAGAAGGCVLVNKDSLVAAGGFDAIKDALIDDCALGRLIKGRAGRAEGGIWVGLSKSTRSLRPYGRLSEIWDMVARSAYTQLNYSPLLLIGTLLGMFLTYLVPPLAVLIGFLFGLPALGLIGLLAWAIMAGTLIPTLRFYGQPFWLAPLLPLSALFYTVMTMDSALQHWRGQGGRWKGRVLDRKGLDR